MLTAGGGHLGVTAEAVGLGGWLGWEERPGSGGPLVGAGALPFTGVLCPSWNRGLESPMAVLGATFLGRNKMGQCFLASGFSPGTGGSWAWEPWPGQRPTQLQLPVGVRQ